MGITDFEPRCINNTKIRCPKKCPLHFAAKEVFTEIVGTSGVNSFLHKANIEETLRKAKVVWEQYINGTMPEEAQHNLEIFIIGKLFCRSKDECNPRA